MSWWTVASVGFAVGNAQALSPFREAQNENQYQALIPINFQWHGRRLRHCVGVLDRPKRTCANAGFASTGSCGRPIQRMHGRQGECAAVGIRQRPVSCDLNRAMDCGRSDRPVSPPRRPPAGSLDRRRITRASRCRLQRCGQHLVEFDSVRRDCVHRRKIPASFRSLGRFCARRNGLLLLSGAGPRAADNSFRSPK